VLSFDWFDQKTIANEIQTEE